MKITIDENAVPYFVLGELLKKGIVSENYNPRKNLINNRKEDIRELLERNGSLMTNIENGKRYVVYEISSLFQVLGSRYVICKEYNEELDEFQGQILVKPLEMFY